MNVREFIVSYRPESEALHGYRSEEFERQMSRSLGQDTLSLSHK